MSDVCSILTAPFPEYRQVSVLEVLWETVQWYTHWNQGHLSPSQSITLETCEDSLLWYAWHKLDIQTYVIFVNLKLLIQGMSVKNKRSDLEQDSFGANYFFHYEGWAVLPHTRVTNHLVSIPHRHLFKIMFNCLYSKSVFITSWVWELPELWE